MLSVRKEIKSEVREKPRSSPQTLCSGKFPRGDERISGVSCGRAEGLSEGEGPVLVFEEEKGSSCGCSRECKVGEQQNLICVFKITERHDN